MSRMGIGPRSLIELISLDFVISDRLVILLLPDSHTVEVYFTVLSPDEFDGLVILPLVPLGLNEHTRQAVELRLPTTFLVLINPRPI